MEKKFLQQEFYNHYGRLLINGECSGIMTVYPLKSFEIEGGRHEE